MERWGLQLARAALRLLEERFEIRAAVQPRRLRYKCSLPDTWIPCGAQSLNCRSRLMQILRCFALAAALALLPGMAFSQGKTVPKDAKVYFITPYDGQTVRGAFLV